MEYLKELFLWYAESQEYLTRGDMQEVKIADASVYELIGTICNGHDFQELEERITSLAVYKEMQGFIYGFQYAASLLAECGLSQKAGDIA